MMALWSPCFIGSTPIGGPIVGANGEHLSPRWAIGGGALGCFATGLVLQAFSHRTEPRRR
jgi:hypothetical protein